MFVVQIGDFFLTDERMESWNSLGCRKDAVRYTDYNAANRMVGKCGREWGIPAQVVKDYRF